MKQQTLLFLIAISLSVGLHAQAPTAFTLQSVVRDVSGQLIANGPIGLRVSLVQGSATGTVVYSETHTATTNDNGLFSVFMGRGQVLRGSFDEIEWGNGPYFAVIETDPYGGTSYSITISQQLVSVPYALYAAKAGSAANGGAGNGTCYATCDEITSLRNRYDAIVATLQARIDSLAGASPSPTPTPGPTPGPTTCNGSTIYGLDVHSSNTSYTWIDGVTYTASNASATYTYPGAATNGCDSVVRLYLVIGGIVPNSGRTCTGVETYGVDVQNGCGSFTWINGITYTTNNYTATFTLRGVNVNGCDSTINLNLTMHDESFGTDVQTSSGPFTWIDGVTYTESNNTAIYTIPNGNTYGCDSTVRLMLSISGVVDGALAGKFSVSASQKVKFSQGNLQYNPFMSRWRFADNQYDIIGNTTGNTAPTAASTDWMDLFGWGTSGYHNPNDVNNTQYYPYSIVSDNSYGPSSDFTGDAADLRGISQNYDWGVYNAISNGGNTAGQWRTLTSDEWNYLFKTRTTTNLNGKANARYCAATVNNVFGVILFPDNYSHPIVVALPPTANINGPYNSSIVYSANDWLLMESAGCVFLPITGYRYGRNAYYHNTTNYPTNGLIMGLYWSSSNGNDSKARYLCIGGPSANFSIVTPLINKSYGLAVRLVKNTN